MEKNELFSSAHPAKALAVMALPTVASQLILLIYNLADTWFIGRTNDPAMVGASNIALTLFLITASIANIFGVGGGSLMMRLVGEKKPDEAEKVASYSVIAAAVSALVFSLVTGIFMEPILKLMGANGATLAYAKQYLLTTIVFGAFPTVLGICMPMLLRNVGYSREAGIGVSLGSILNILLDPLFMFVILPPGKEVLGAGIATLISNIISFLYFVIMFVKVRKETVLKVSFKSGPIGHMNTKALYGVGIPAAISIFLFDLVNIAFNRLSTGYGDGVKPLAAMGIVLKLERIPINTGLGICLGMVPLIAFNYGAKNYKRLEKISGLALRANVIFALCCSLLYWFMAGPLVGIFMKEESTVALGAVFLMGRCFSLPLMTIGTHVTNYMNAIGQGKYSFLLAFIRHIVFILPILFVFNHFFGLNGLIWAQVAADLFNSVFALTIYHIIRKKHGLIVK
jgi:putative MATE family efflux protein